MKDLIQKTSMIERLRAIYDSEYRSELCAKFSVSEDDFMSECANEESIALANRMFD